MSLDWKLRQVMAKKEIWSATDLIMVMEDKAGYSITPASVSKLINEKPKMMRMETLDALCTALECKPNDLIIHKSTNMNKVEKKESLQQKEQLKVVNNDRPLPPI